MKGYIIAHPDECDPYTWKIKNKEGKEIEVIPVFYTPPHAHLDEGMKKAYEFAELFLEMDDEFNCVLIDLNVEEKFGSERTTRELDD